MGAQLEVQQLLNAAWKNLGVIGKVPPEQAVEEIAPTPGIYRLRNEGSDEPWRYFYVDEEGRARDSGAVSNL